MPKRVTFLFLAALAACGKSPKRSDSAAPAIATTTTTTTLEPLCEPYLVTELTVPKDWRSFAIVARSGHARTVETRSVDHYVSELLDVPLGPFVVRYWQEQTHPQAGDVVIRLDGCRGSDLPIPSSTYWNGGGLVLRNKDNVFVISTAGTEQVIAAVRRLPT